MSKNGQSKGSLLVLLAAVLWGCIGYFVRQLAGLGFTPMQVVAIRVTTAAVFFSVVIFFWNRAAFRIRLRDIWMFIGTGIFSLVFFNWCNFSAMEELGVSVAAVLLYTSPVFVMLLSALLFREKLTLRSIGALVLTLAGCICTAGLVGGEKVSLWGVVTGIGAGFGYALYSIFSRFALQKGYSSVTITLYTFIMAAIGALPLAQFGENAAMLPRTDTLLFALGVGVLCCVAPFLLYTLGMETLDNGRAAVLATLEPAVASLIGFFILREAATPMKLAGILLIFAGILLLSLPARSKRKEG